MNNEAPGNPRAPGPAAPADGDSWWGAAESALMLPRP
jgi:hypothetical protein